MIEDENTGLLFIDPSQVEMIPIGKLKLYKRNAKKHTPEQIEQIVNSIKAFGMNDPIAVWGDDNVIVEGHGRYMALRSIGEQGEVPCIRLDHLTDEQRKAYALAHNKLTMNTGFDEEYLLPELEELGDFFDMADFGFDDGDDEQEDKAPTEVTEDDFDESTVTESVCKRGQVWKLGGHRLMCGDSTSAEDVARLMNGEKAELLFTSPPYSDLREYTSDGDLSPENISRFIPAFAEHCEYQAVNLGLVRRDKEIIPYWDVYIDRAHEAGLKLMAWNVWDKGECGSVGMQSAFIPIRHEWIFVFGTKDKDLNLTWKKKPESINDKQYHTQRMKDGTTKRMTRGDTTHVFKEMESVILITPEKLNSVRTLHPATFPVKFPAEYIQALTNEGDIVTEPFGGSGSTMIACEQLDRRCFMMEISPHYCDVIIKRWEDFTGKKAELIEG